MSRVGKKPIPVPEKVTLDYKNRLLTVKGQKGALSQEIHQNIELKIEKGIVSVVPLTITKKNQALSGMTRSLINNMITGVDQGFERVLEINGIGYRAEVKGNALVLSLGFSHPVQYELPEGISATVDRNNVIKLTGIDKQKLGQTAAIIRGFRPPEPYKGKGIKYAEEYIRRKAGKSGTK